VLRVNEIFYSIQGESRASGLPCVFVRLSGCNLRCSYCDTRHAWDGGMDMTGEQVLERVGFYGCRRVAITGGEPLLQPDAPRLAAALLREGYAVLLETNGSKDISALPDGVVRIVDIKCPGSGESGRMDWKNLGRLRADDEVKFVLCGETDYDWARDTVLENALIEKAAVLFSPVSGQLHPACLAEWMLRDRLDVRLQLQLHKILWPSAEQGH